MPKLVDDEARVRRFTQRSKNGCAGCRRAHIRCDEKRPICGKCALSGKTCEYTVYVPSIERKRARLPGVDAPWLAVGQPARTAADPFDCLPISMPYKSKELLQYFTVCHGVFKSKPEKDCVYFAVDDPAALRSTLLIAALHYWGSNVGTLSMRSFEATYLFHKIECIRMVNEWLNSPDLRLTMRCVKLITTLSLVEVCLGNPEAASAHLAAVYKLLDLRPSKLDNEDDTEMFARYILIALNFTARLVRETLAIRSRGVMNINQEWQRRAFLAVPDRLMILRQVPYFFNSPERASPREIDASSTIRELRLMTGMFDKGYPNAGGPWSMMWHARGQVTMLMSAVKSQAQSVTKASDPSAFISEGFIPGLDPYRHPLLENLRSSYCGLGTAGRFYLEGVLGWADPRQNVHLGILVREVDVLTMDLDKTETAAHNDENQRAFWLWKAFSGAYYLTQILDAIDADAAPSEADTALYVRCCSLLREINERIHRWSAASGITEWIIVREALSKIVWPLDSSKIDNKAEDLWEDSHAATSERGV